MAIAFDAPWHGERALPEAGLRDLSLKSLGPAMLHALASHEEARLNVYFDALVRGWRTGSDRFVLDISRDALTVVDYLVSRHEIWPESISATGVSLGGMACWLLAAADTRICSAMPAIGVQSFNHALVNGLWGARVDSIRRPFEVAAAEMRKAAVDGEVVAAVWSRLAPGLAEARPSQGNQRDVRRDVQVQEKLAGERKRQACIRCVCLACACADAFNVDVQLSCEEKPGH